MALTTTGLAVTKRVRDHSYNGFVANVLNIYADLSWVNTSDENHWVEITVTGRSDSANDADLPTSSVVRTVTQQRGATTAARVLLTTWRARSDSGSLDLTRTVTISVKATNGTTSSTPTTSEQTVTLAQTVSAFSSPYYSGDGEILLPQLPSAGASPSMAFSSSDSDARGLVFIEPIGATPGSPARFSMFELNQTKLSREVLSEYLNDGGFYKATLYWRKPKALTSADCVRSFGFGWPTLIDQVSDVVEFSTTFEYWRNGKKAPVITSPLGVTAAVGSEWTYRIAANGATSFDSDLVTLAIDDAEDESVNTETGELSAVFGAAGTNTIEIEATNEVGTTTANLTVEVVAITTDDVTATIAKNKQAKIRLTASHDSTWALTSGNLPPGMTIVQSSPPSVLNKLGTMSSIFGTPITNGAYSAVLTATQKGTCFTATATVNITVTDTGTPEVDDNITEILAPTNVTTYTSDDPLLVGEQFSVGLISRPAAATWSATGLPPGVSINTATGLVSGTLTAPGRFSALVTAKADGYLTSLPVLISVVVDPAAASTTTTGGTSSEALNRMPWLAQQWSLIDIQVSARTRKVQSTLDEQTGIRIKAGDDLNFAVFFMDSAGSPFRLPITKLRLTIRESNNLDDPLVLESDDSPAVSLDFPDPCFLLTSAKNAAGRSDMRDIVEGWTANSSDKDIQTGLPCTADVEWEFNGQTFSSDAFPVFVGLDVSR